MIQTDVFWGCLFFFFVWEMSCSSIYYYYSGDTKEVPFIDQIDWILTYLTAGAIWKSTFNNQNFSLLLLLKQVYLKKLEFIIFSLSVVKGLAFSIIFSFMNDFRCCFFFLHVFTPMCWILCFDSPFIFYSPFIVKKHYVSN